ncbi:unnamed protein product [Cylicocyclus nassatus]|uniref:Uncharacterized protein n=1 Tax=Cylicocyclus nassatus TaxID=53992 RepID=A0AA36M3E5_CYLNA|nr:unnamed protein product [Cylicocyclus nassatus]
MSILLLDVVERGYNMSDKYYDLVLSSLARLKDELYVIDKKRYKLKAEIRRLSGEYQSPIYMANDGTAIRAVTNAVNDIKDNPVKENYKDKQLYCLAFNPPIAESCPTGDGFEPVFELQVDKKGVKDLVEVVTNTFGDIWNRITGKTQQMDFEDYLSSSAHQREVADLEKAGLNPVLSATGGYGADSPSVSGSSGNLISTATGIVSSAASLMESVNHKDANEKNRQLNHDSAYEQYRDRKITNDLYNKVGEYQSPIYMANDGTAIRAVTNAVNDIKDNPVKENYKDKQLYCLAFNPPIAESCPTGDGFEPVFELQVDKKGVKDLVEVVTNTFGDIWNRITGKTQQMDFEDYLSSSAHQREVADLEKAGLNPVLSATGGYGADSPSVSGSSGNLISTATGIVSSAASLMESVNHKDANEKNRQLNHDSAYEQYRDRKITNDLYNKVGEYQSPIYMANDGTAIRAVTNAVNDIKDNPVKENYKDKQLYCLAFNPPIAESCPTGDGFEPVFELQVDKKGVKDLVEVVTNTFGDIWNRITGKTQQMDFEDYLSSSAHQREVADLEKAGLNPVLSATGGYGADSPSVSGSSGNLISTATGIVSSAASLMESVNHKDANEKNRQLNHDSAYEQYRDRKITNDLYNKVGEYQSPIYMANDGTAIRAVTNAVNDIKDNPVKENYKDKQLYCLAFNPPIAESCPTGDGFEPVFELQVDKKGVKDLVEVVTNTFGDIWNRITGKTQQMDFEDYLSSSAHQREVADLEKAGLNPVLSATGGYGADSPSVSGSSGNLISTATGIVSSAASLMESVNHKDANEKNRQLNHDSAYEQYRDRKITNDLYNKVGNLISTAKAMLSYN